MSYDLKISYFFKPNIGFKILFPRNYLYILPRLTQSFTSFFDSIKILLMIQKYNDNLIYLKGLVCDIQHSCFNYHSVHFILFHIDNCGPHFEPSKSQINDLILNNIELTMI